MTQALKRTVWARIPGLRLQTEKGRRVPEKEIQAALRATGRQRDPSFCKVSRPQIPLPNIARSQDSHSCQHAAQRNPSKLRRGQEHLVFSLRLLGDVQRRMEG